MNMRKTIYFAGGSIGGKQGQSGGSIGGRAGHSGGSIGGNTGGSGGSIPGRSSHSNNDNTECIILDSLKKGELIYADVLRSWRDESLSNSYIGKSFIKNYYLVSPKLVMLAEKLPIINTVVRKIALSVAKLVY